jgi:hypothetical protein
MNNKGAVLVFGLVIILVLSVLSASFYYKSINENNLNKRYTESIRAFWLAEAGIAEAIDHIPTLTTSGNIGDANYTYSTQAVLTATNLYTITSTGSVTMPTGGTVTRSLIVDVKTGTANPANFPYAIETTTNLVIRGSVDINPDNSKKEYSTLDFTALFGFTKADIRSYATHLYTSATFGAPVNGITWVDVPVGSTLTIAGNLVGSGILVISGNTHFAGTVDFNGIIYVIGTLTMTGTVITNGSVLAESSTTVDTTLKGNVTLNWNQEQIDLALVNIRLLTRDIVSWQES